MELKFGDALEKEGFIESMVGAGSCPEDVLEGGHGFCGEEAEWVDRKCYLCWKRALSCHGPQTRGVPRKKPKLCKILGVEPDEPFWFEGEGWVVTETGTEGIPCAESLKTKLPAGALTLAKMVEHPGRVSRTPYGDIATLTEDGEPMAVTEEMRSLRREKLGEKAKLVNKAIKEAVSGGRDRAPFLVKETDPDRDALIEWYTGAGYEVDFDAQTITWGF